MGALYKNVAPITRTAPAKKLNDGEKSWKMYPDTIADRMIDMPDAKFFKIVSAYLEIIFEAVPNIESNKLDHGGDDETTSSAKENHSPCQVVVTLEEALVLNTVVVIVVHAK